MRFFVLVSSLLITGAVHATPAEAPDDISKFLADKPVLQHIQQAGQTVSTKASSLVVNALGFLGVPYRRGGTSADTGFDCSGFVKTVYEETVGLVLPRVAAQQAAQTEKVARADLKPGDLVFFNTMRRTFSHVGIYIGDGKFVHSPKPGEEVRVESMSMAYWKRRFTGARRVLTGADDTPETPTAVAAEPALR
ncbi:C40 family peptidase [Rhodoferax sp. U11-2br]|uniref:C40 family peptidase n=1 Tax=Rhodoferax sp. U11-2br TaxID=2838878 RepID=UPI001BE71112|nr:C40 family peptidase [Rhodoferax sp. U11-2br]MBT3066669.1 C40 family peptidase [Rhodoferax sp. U11-2br]